MTSAVTNDIKSLLLQSLKTDVDGDSSQFHVGISRSTDFTASTNISSRKEQQDIRHAIQSVKTVSNVSFVIPYVAWSNRVFNAWNDTDIDQEDFYVVNSNREVFICINNAKDTNGTVVASSIEPFASVPSNTGVTFPTGDGYSWRYMYRVSNLAWSNYRTLEYLPVQSVASGVVIDEEQEQLTLQANAVDGEIINIAIDSGGTGYTSAPTINIQGNGTSAQFTATLTLDGAVGDVPVSTDVDSTVLHGSDYDYAKPVPVTGDAVLRAVIAPEGGLNYDPIASLKSNSIMLQADIIGNENSTILDQNDFRQVVLFRNLKKYGSDSDFTSNTGNGMKSFTVSNRQGVGTFPEDALISNATQTASAKVFYDDGATLLYWYQDEETGFGTFAVSDVIDNSGLTSMTISVINNPDFDAYSGDILYINNLSQTVDKVSNQTEDVKIILTLG